MPRTGHHGNSLPPPPLGVTHNAARVRLGCHIAMGCPRGKGHPFSSPGRDENRENVPFACLWVTSFMNGQCQASDLWPSPVGLRDRRQMPGAGTHAHMHTRAHTHTVGLEWRRRPLPKLLVGAGHGVETQAHVTPYLGLLHPQTMTQPDLHPTHVSVQNPHPARVHVPQQKQGGAAPTLPPLGEPQRPNHTPFLLGLACLGSHSCSQNRRPSQARGEAWRGGAGDAHPSQAVPCRKKAPNVRLCPGAEHFGPPGPELAALPSAVSPPRPTPPLPSPTGSCNWSRAGGGPGGGPQPRPPWPARLTLSAQREES